MKESRIFMLSFNTSLVSIGLLIILGNKSFAQDIEPRRWTELPLGTHILGVGYAHTNGKIFFDPLLQVENATFNNDAFAFQYIQLNIRDILISPTENRLADISVDWIMVGGTKYFPKGKIRPFVGSALGLVILSPSNENRNIINSSLDNETKFASSFKGGINIMFSDRIGLNLQGNLMFPVNWGGVYVGCGSEGISAVAGVSSTTLIGGFSGGLVIQNKITNRFGDLI